MKFFRPFFVAALAAGCAAITATATAATPKYQITLDVQHTDNPFSVKNVYTYDVMTIRANLEENGSAWNPTNYGGYLAYFIDGYSSTSYVRVAAATVATSYIDFTTTAATFTSNGNWLAMVVLTNAAGGAKTWAHGRVTVLANPALGSATPTVLRTPINWSGLSYSGTADDGPVRAGTGISVTTNSDGSLAFSVSCSATNGLASIAQVAAAANSATGYAKEVSAQWSTNPATSNIKLGSFMMSFSGTDTGFGHTGGQIAQIEGSNGVQINTRGYVQCQAPIIGVKATNTATSVVVLSQLSVVSNNVEALSNTIISATNAIVIPSTNGLASVAQIAAATAAATNYTDAATGACYQASNPSGYMDKSVTNGLYPVSNPSGYVTQTVTNGLAPTASVVAKTGDTMTGTLGLSGVTNGLTWGGTNVFLAREGAVGGTNTIYWTQNGTNYHLRLW